MKWYHYIIIGAFLPILVWGSYRIGYTKGRREPIRPQTDTITIIREKTSYKPQEVATIRYSTIPIPQVIFRSDTVIRFIVDSARVELPIVHKVYRGDDYEVVVSGAFPQLDYCKTFSKEMVVTKTAPKSRWSFGMQVGIGVQYGLISRRFDAGPYIGVGVGYNF